MPRSARLSLILVLLIAFSASEAPCEVVRVADALELDSAVVDRNLATISEFVSLQPSQPPDASGSSEDSSVPNITRPPVATPRRRSALASAPAARATRRPTYMRLASLPKMFGDSLVTYHINVIKPFGVISDLDADFPIGSGAAYRVSNRNSAAVGSCGEVFFYYDHFHNAISAETRNLARQDFGLDQYTVGFEKVLRPGVSSIMVRMPLFTDFQFGDNLDGIRFGSVGNLVVIPKRVIRETEDSVLSIGCGVTFPTGSDVNAHRFDVVFNFDDPFRLKNESYHLLPFVAWLWSPEASPYYVHAWLQGDFAANGNRVETSDGFFSAKLTEQNYVVADLGVGRLLLDAPGRFVSRIAAQVEVHWAHTLNDADVAVLNVFGAQTPYDVTFSSTANRRDVVNLTAGVVTQLADRWELGVAGVVPLADQPDRFFNAEIKAHAIRKF